MYSKKYGECAIIIFPPKKITLNSRQYEHKVEHDTTSIVIDNIKYYGKIRHHAKLTIFSLSVNKVFMNNCLLLSI